MATWFSSTNYARTLAAAAIAPGPATATGYEKTALVDGGPGLMWRAASAVSSLEIAFDLGSSQPVSLIAAVNVIAESGGVEFDDFSAYSASAAPAEFGGGGSWTLRANTTPIPSDGLLDVRSGGAAISARYWKMAINFSGSTIARVGECWIGNLLALPKAPQSLSLTSTYPAIINESDVGNVYAARIGQRRRTWNLTFPPMTAGSATNLDAAFDAAFGASLPMLYVSSSSDLQAFAHGRIEDSRTFSTDVSGLQFQRALVFAESGRGI